jgi:cytochrome c551/c552
MRKSILALSLISSILFASEELASTNGCLECHKITYGEVAPAFAGIAKKNLRFNDRSMAKEIIIDSIKNGSSGKYRRFSSTTMPNFSHFNESELDSLAEWILSLESLAKSKNFGGGMGMGNRGMGGL